MTFVGRIKYAHFRMRQGFLTPYPAPSISIATIRMEPIKIKTLVCVIRIFIGMRQIKDTHKPGSEFYSRDSSKKYNQKTKEFYEILCELTQKQVWVNTLKHANSHHILFSDIFLSVLCFCQSHNFLCVNFSVVAVVFSFHLCRFVLGLIFSLPCFNLPHFNSFWFSLCVSSIR